MTIFGPEWTSLALEDVGRFLRTVDEGEGLLWEAKGTHVHPGEIRKQVCGFANSHDGGYLILGARWLKSDSEWCMDGVSFEGEPTLWISDVVQSGVRPLPRFDVVGWPVDDERHVAVVKVDPTPTPPCNANGTVYERVAGATVSVRDPQRLAELFRRGDQARRSAELLATDAALRLLDRGREVDGYRDELVHFVVGLSTVGRPPDISSRLFSRSFESDLTSIVDTVLRQPGPLQSNLSIDWTQSSRTASLAMMGPVHYALLAQASWDGSIGIFVVGSTDQVDIERLAETHVRNAWIAALEMQKALAGFGDVYVCLLVGPKPIGAKSVDQMSGRVRLTRGPLPPEVPDDTIVSIVRELRRSAGYAGYEG